MALLLAGTGWAAIGEVDVIAVADGKVIPSGKVKVIQPLEAGTVKAIHVDDGQQVKAGEKLIELDPTARMADRDRLANNLLAIETDIARLKVMRLPMPEAIRQFSPPKELDEASKGHQIAMLQSELGEHSAQISGIDSEIKRQRAQIAVTSATIERIDKLLPLLEERVEVRRGLAEKGYGSRMTYLEIEQQHIDLRQQQRELRLKIAETEANIGVLRDQKVRALAEFSKNIASRLIEAERVALSLTQELLKAEQQYTYQTLTSPIDGVVHQLLVHTIGGVVASGQTLMMIVPQSEAIEIEALVLNKDAGFVRPRQTVDLKFDTYQFTVYGTVPGEVKEVSKDSVLDPKFGLVYPARITLLKREIHHNGNTLSFAPGMHLTADIKTDRRKVWDFLLSPLLKLKDESARER